MPSDMPDYRTSGVGRRPPARRAPARHECDLSEPRLVRSQLPRAVFLEGHHSVPKRGRRLGYRGAMGTSTQLLGALRHSFEVVALTVVRDRVELERLAEEQAALRRV